jgi:hypothetical protein
MLQTLKNGAPGYGGALDVNSHRFHLGALSNCLVALSNFSAAQRFCRLLAMNRIAIGEMTVP